MKKTTFGPEYPIFWQILLIALVLVYGLLYAPYGINETDGGFLTGLAWQWLNGKPLYSEIIYVRPPLPVWWRAGEMMLLPQHWAILGERWFFYIYVALYSLLGASVLATGVRRWQTACFGFVVSAHCYPPAAWHTTYGIFLGALSFWLLYQKSTSGRRRQVMQVLSGLAIVGALWCKQSFYPLALMYPLLTWQERRNTALFSFLFFFALSLVLVFGTKPGMDFLLFSSTAVQPSQGGLRGLLDFVRIQPTLLVSTLIWLAGVFYWQKKSNARDNQAAGLLFAGLFVLSVMSYVAKIWGSGQFTPPFAASRLWFDAAVLYGLWAYFIGKWTLNQSLRFTALMAITWCAAISWGYNLPILFATPWVWIGLEVSAGLKASLSRARMADNLLALFLLFLTFNLGYQWIYRDGHRTQMTVPMGTIFPQLTGIYSDEETAARYRELKQLTLEAGPGKAVKTLPAFPQSNYLTGTRPPLPLDWVVLRETGPTWVKRLSRYIEQPEVIFLVEKKYLPQIETDPEMPFERQVLQQKKLITDGVYFQVYQ